MESLARKNTKYELLINSIKIRGWNIAPLMVLTKCARAFTHISSMKSLEIKLEYLAQKIKNILNQINTIVAQYAQSISED